jgi:hypothetical protein
MPASGTILDSTIVSMRPMDVTITARHGSIGPAATIITIPDDREIFKVYFCV